MDRYQINICFVLVYAVIYVDSDNIWKLEECVSI